jgi:archaellum component FlaC
MDKKAKHRIDVLQQRLQKLRMQLAGVKKQTDEPEEAGRLENEIKTVSAELEKLKSS